MELKKIKGNSCFIYAPTNIGIYYFKNKSAVVFDTGINSNAAKKIDDVLLSNGIFPKYIVNSHCHTDHCGGNTYFKNNYTGAVFYSSGTEKLFIENGDLFPAMLCSSRPIKFLDRLKATSIDYVIDAGNIKINDEKFEILSLPGHSMDQIGLLTPDKVCYAGDAVFSKEIIHKYSFPNLYSVKDSIDTLNKLKSIDADYFVIGHSEYVYDKDEMVDLCCYNIDNITKYQSLLLELLSEPMSREDLLENIVVLCDISLDFKEYYLCLSSISAFISYFCEMGVIDFSIENGRMYYYKKS